MYAIEHIYVHVHNVHVHIYAIRLQGNVAYALNVRMYVHTLRLGHSLQYTGKSENGKE